MLKFTRNSATAFDFRDVLSFEGENGAICMVVRANIFRKAGVTETSALEMFDLDVAAKEFGRDDGLWELWLTAAKLSLALEQSIAAAEPAYLAKYAFQLAQQFNNFYHRYHILNETDEARERLLASAVGVGIDAGAGLDGDYCSGRDVSADGM